MLPLGHDGSRQNCICTSEWEGKNSAGTFAWGFFSIGSIAGWTNNPNNKVHVISSHLVSH